MEDNKLMYLHNKKFKKMRFSLKIYRFYFPEIKADCYYFYSLNPVQLFVINFDYWTNIAEYYIKLN